MARGVPRGMDDLDLTPLLPYHFPIFQQTVGLDCGKFTQDQPHEELGKPDGTEWYEIAYKLLSWSEHEIPPTSDAFVLEVFDAEGVLLQRFPLDHYADVLRIGGDRLYILDKVRRMQVNCYRIID